MLRIGHLELFVRDVLSAKNFYREVLGFAVTVEQGPDLVWLEKDGLELLLRKGAGPAPVGRYADAPVGIVLYTSNLQASQRDLEAHGLVFRGTVDTEKCLTFTDLDGHWFQLVDPGDH